MKADNSVESIIQLVEHSPSLQELMFSFNEGDEILKEGVYNDHVYILLEGEVSLGKKSEGGTSVEIDHFGPGSMLGLTSFWAQESSFVTSRAASEVKCLMLNRKKFDELVDTDPHFSKEIQLLFIGNLSERYRRMMKLNLKIAMLSKELEEERNQLKEAIENLEKTRGQLVHHEKLATLGQLLAGIAHEINNPSASLQRNVEELITTIPNFFEKGGALEKLPEEAKLFHAGITCPFWSAHEKTERMENLENKYPDLKRSTIRKLAQFPNETIEALNSLIKKAGKEKHLRTLSNLIGFFEVGVYLRSIKISGERINSLVKSLKNYGRQDQSTEATVDLREGIQDTLTILNNKLKHFKLGLDLQEIPQIKCFPGELNQIWTNLLTNACDALEPQQEINISTKTEDGYIIVIVEDNGPGIAKNLLGKIFETNFTTKNSSKSFGLGMGLAISREIIEKHGGSIIATNRESGGARFITKLPIAADL